MAISIDFGTSNTVIARWNPATQQAETINLPGLSLISTVNPPLIPSLVYVHNAATADLAIGQAVRDRGLDVASDQRSFAGFKRGIGAQIQGFLPELDGQQITFEQVGSWFLQQVWQAVGHIDHSNESLVVTVPVDSFDTYRSWLGQVCQQLAIEQVSLLDESTAAALGYGLDQGLILVVDCGGGTIDLSLVQLVAKPSQQLGFLLKFGNKVLDKSAQNPNWPKSSPKLAKIWAVPISIAGLPNIWPLLKIYESPRSSCAWPKSSKSSYLAPPPPPRSSLTIKNWKPMNSS